MLRSFAIAVAFFLATTATQAQTATRVDVYEYGSYSSNPGVEVDKTRAGFSHKHTDGIELIESTRTIVAQLGGAFGFRFRATGSSPGTSIPLTIVVKFPAAGVLAVGGRVPVTGDEYVETAVVGDDQFLTWKFENRTDLVPGIWLIEIWQGEHKLAEQPFKVILPPIS